MFDERFEKKTNCLLESKLQPKRWFKTFIDIICSKVWEKPLVKDIALGIYFFLQK